MFQNIYRDKMMFCFSCMQSSEGISSHRLPHTGKEQTIQEKADMSVGEMRAVNHIPEAFTLAS